MDPNDLRVTNYFKDMSKEDVEKLLQRKREWEATVREKILQGKNPEDMSDDELQAALEMKRRMTSHPMINLGDLRGSAVEDLAREEVSEIYENKPSPHINMFDRAIIKNFGNDPGDAVMYLREKYPDLEIFHDGREVIVRAPGEEKFRPMDPTNDLFSVGDDDSYLRMQNYDLPFVGEVRAPSIDGAVEFLKDTGDIAYDVGAGLTTGAATALGGLKGAAVGGVGAIPGAMAAGAGTDAALEAGRQGIGRGLGVNQEMDWLGVGFSGATGAAAPLLFGTGAGAKQVAKEALKRNLPKEGAEQLMRSQSGLPVQASRKVFPWVGEKMSGIDRDIIRHGYRKMGEINDLEKTGVRPLVSRSKRQIQDGLRQRASTVGRQIDDAFEEAGDVNIKESKKILKDYIEELSQRQPTRENASLLQQAKDEYDQIFKMDKKQAQSVLLDAKGNPVQAAKEFTEEVPDIMSAQQARTDIYPNLKSAAEMQKYTGGVESRNARKATADQVLENRLGDSARSIKNQFDEIVPGYGPDDAGIGLREEYSGIKKTQRELRNAFKDDKSSLQTLRNLGNNSNDIVRDTLAKMDDSLGTTAIDDAMTLKAFDTFRKPDLLPLGSTFEKGVRAAPLAGAGGLAGYYTSSQMGGGHGSGVAGFGLGAGLGALLGGPKAMRFYIDQARRAGAAKNFINPYATRAIYPVFNMYESRDQQTTPREFYFEYE